MYSTVIEKMEFLLASAIWLHHTKKQVHMSKSHPRHAYTGTITIINELQGDKTL